jgi:hypothetical protein
MTEFNFSKGLKGNLIALGICASVIGVSAYINYEQSTLDNNTSITAMQSDPLADLKSYDDTTTDTNDDSGFVSTGFTQETTKKDPEIGMNISEVDNSTWGRAGDITRTKDQFGESQLWIYMDGRSLFFQDGILESITQ